MHPSGPGSLGTIVDHATLTNNGAELQDWEKKQGGNIYIGGGDVTVTNSRIDGSQWAAQGEGARFQYRYVDRALTDQPLWPWPMEGRAQSELGVSVNEIAAKYANTYGFSLRMDSAARQVDRNGTVEVKVNVDSFGKFANPVKLHVAPDGPGLGIDPVEATIMPPSEWSFKISAPDERAIRTLKVTATADGAGTVERTLVIMIDPELIYLPGITNRVSASRALANK